MRTTTSTLPCAPARQALAWLLAALVLALTLLAVSPRAHAWLHGDATLEAAHACDNHAPSPASPDGEPADCPIFLFAQGIPLPPDLLLVVAPCITDAAPAFPVPAELHLSSPNALRPPGRAPPAVG